VTVAAGTTSITFNVTTTAVAASTSATITATYGTTQTATLGINPVLLASVAMNPAVVVGGNPSTGTVTLNGPAPAGGALVTLSNTNTTAATVPASVTVAAGTTSITFNVTTTAVTASTSATITGVYNGSTQTAGLTITP
jgi:trimeric autotransporter adhesin